MAVPYHTHSFEIPSATKAEVEAGVRTDVAATPASLGSAASKDVSYFATASQGNNADTAVQPTLLLTAGDGLTGGGTLAANRTFALSSTSLASLALADTAVQTINGKSGRTITLSSGDVSAVPIAREAEIIANTAARHTHSNKAVLDATTAAFTTAMSSKLAGIPADADKTPGVATVMSNGLMSSGDKTKLDDIAAGATANTGTVTSVAVTVPAGLAVAGTPISTAGTFAISYAAGYRGYTTAEANKLAGIPADADKTPALAAVATSGNYADLNGKPTLGSLAAKNNIAVADISATGTPSAATFLRGDGTWGTVAGAGTVTSVGLSAPTGFAVSGSPVTGSGTLTISYASGYKGYTTAEANKLAGIPADADKTPALAAVATTGSYGDLSGKPATFPPSAHTHTPSEVGLGNVANKSEAQMVASGAIADALEGKLGTEAKAADSALLNGQTAAQLPVSAATQSALNGKASLSGTNFTGAVKIVGTTISVVGNIPAYFLQSPGAAYAYTMGANISDTVYGSWRVQAGFGGTVLLECFGSDNRVHIPGALSKGSGTFLIDHPLDPANKNLRHGFVEAPEYVNIYRGVVRLVNGKAAVNIDDYFGMVPGTFSALNADIMISSLQNQEGGTVVWPDGKMTGAILNITCADETCNDEIAWMVTGRRKDAFVLNLDPNCERGTGRFIPEVDKEA